LPIFLLNTRPVSYPLPSTRALLYPIDVLTHAKVPASSIYEILCERLVVLPQEVVFLDNHPQIIETAKEFGIHAVLCENTEQAIAAVEAILAKYA
jgi:FMN phosphatase YigB (HAD superfamily)